ncbi:MAG: molybdate ABC transporter substrate-binding protein [Actinomycetes bacterium]
MCALLLPLTGCGGDADSADVGGPDTPSWAATGVSGTVTVLAAASLTEAFGRLGETFETQNPDADVRFSFAASSELATQITQGAPADVFASASPSTMHQVVDADGTSGDPKVFVRNRLEIAVPSGNPAGVTWLADFARDPLKIALCAPEVPCGAAADTAFAAAGVTPRPDTLEADVKATLSKVTLGEVDAALVYRSDVKAAGSDVEGIDFPESDEAINDYPIAKLAGGPNPSGAEAFVELVLSDQGLAVLTEAGFERP